ncbi:unnamed protein product [Plutella xylostella]|uniref:(diamondback moth) hypothetical protein n=1 Tax=Plutella xylostella TaxID=51655 RepID=A0A8S4DPI6_PLUXY|nr:unnamed protein product [Plutella xylostella]
MIPNTHINTNIINVSPIKTINKLERWQCLAGVHARAAARGVEGDRLLAALLDLATLTRVLGRLAPALLQGEMY